jgi:hypothetical protein
LLAAGCASTTSDAPSIRVTHEVKPDPPMVGLATVALALEESGGRAISGAKVALEGNMSHPGMTPVFAEAREVTPGRYEAPLDLTMAGDWIVTATITLADGRRIGEQFDVRGVRPKE